MNDLELQREVRAALRRREADVNDPAAVPPARLVLRQTRRRQLATVLITAAVAIALVLVAVTGITSLLRSAERLTPATPPSIAPAVLRASVSWDGTRCLYEGPHTIVGGQQMLALAERQRLRIRFENRSNSEDVALVFAGLPSGADYQAFVAWSATHAPNFFGSFPPKRFFVPGVGNILGAGSLRDGIATTKPFDTPGAYYVACLALPPDAQGSTIHPAALLQVTRP